jgi:enoyl-CoA hydratase
MAAPHTSDHTCFAVDVADHVAHIRMIRPERANSMIPAFWRELPAIVNAISDAGEARVIVLSAEGRHFCSGMDTTVFTGTGGLASGGGGGEPGPSSARRAAGFREMALHMQESFTCFERARVPVICAVQGACVGGGVDMITAADLRYATADAFFCIQEINIGMTADAGTFPRLCRLIPQGWVRELAYTGRRLPAEAAREIGLVNAVLPDPEAVVAHALAVAREIAAKSPLAVAGSKVMINYAREHDTETALDYLRVWQAGMFPAADMAETFKARQEGREPDFPDLRPVHRGM